MKTLGTLRASALIETIVASMIFLLVFALSVDTVVRLSATDDIDGLVLVEADHKTNECFSKYSSEMYLSGEYTDEYDWGRITTEITAYGKYKELRQITLTTDITMMKRKMIYRRIIKNTCNE